MSSIVIAGDTSGSVTLQAPAVAGSTVLNLPATSGTIQTSGAGYTTNGVAYASSTSALTTGSALTFDGTNFATTGTITSGGSYNFNTTSGRDILWGTSSYTYITGNPSTGVMAFGIASSELMRLTSTGLGIGTSLPAVKLQISSGEARVRLTATNASSGSWELISGGGGVTGAGYFALYDVANSAQKIVIAPSAGEAIRIDGSNNVGIGTSSPSTKLDVSGNAKSNGYTFNYNTSYWNVDGYLSNYSATNGVYLNGNASGWLHLNADGTQATRIKLYGSSNATPNIIEFTTASSERARIDSSGNLLVGTTSNPASLKTYIGVVYNGASEYGSSFKTSHSSGIACNFLNSSGTQVGNITTQASSTAYNTSSDYRLKNTIIPMTGALAKVTQLKPCTYKWNVDGSDGEGFIAHELAEVCPNAVTGEKDAVQTYTDENGNEQTRPVYQGIDVSFLVATLTAAIQEQQALINTLTERISVLENK